MELPFLTVLSWRLFPKSQLCLPFFVKITINVAVQELTIKIFVHVGQQ